jgi:hypothetical protein
MVLVIAQIKRRGGGRRRTPFLLAGKGGGMSHPIPKSPLPSRPVGGGSFGVLRRDVESAQASTFEARLRQPQDDSGWSTPLEGIDGKVAR